MRNGFSNDVAVNGISIPKLRAAFPGRVIGPEDAGYPAARAVFFGEYDRRAAVILLPSGMTDVAFAVSLARDTG